MNKLFYTLNTELYSLDSSKVLHAIAQGADVNHTPPSRRSPLHHHLQLLSPVKPFERQVIVQALLSAGANPNYFR